MTFADARAEQVRLEAAVAAAAAALRAVPGVGSGPLRLTPDPVRQTPAYQAARATYDAAFAALRRFNRGYVRTFAAERQRPPGSTPWPPASPASAATRTSPTGTPCADARDLT
jgi:hypothetical protein